jgi:hypothetical protein
MAALDDPMAQVTRLPNLAFVDDHDNRYRALNTPILSQQEIVDIPVTENLVGGIVFNKNTEELETYTAAGFWLPILTAESDINVETLTAQTVNAINADLTHIHSNDITNDAVITTLGLLTTGDAQVNGTLHVQTNLQVDGSATVNSLVVNNNALMDGLVVNNSAVIQENLQVNGTSTFQTGSVSGNLGVNGTLHSSILNNDNLITTLGLHVTSNAQIDGNMLCASGGVTGNLGVNGNLTAGNLATTGTLLVDGASTLQDTTIDGTLSVTGSSTFSSNVVVNGNTTLKDTGLTGTLTVVGSGVFSNEVFANDVQGTSVQPQKLLYGLANSDGTAPITATLDVGAGTGATCTITGSNVAGTISIHTGTSPVLGVIATFTLPSILNSLMTGKGSMIMTPGSITTALYEQGSKTYLSTSTGNVIGLFGSSQTALAASTTYIWNYVIIGNQLGT